jgi:hypothetical protein
VEAAHFADIRFGFASAEKEGAEAPDLLLGGFLDEEHLTETALAGSPFLFLGYKGSGKTALAEHARLIAERTPDLFVTTTTLDHFSYADFKAIAGGSADQQVRFPIAWAWLLLIALVQSLQDDAAGVADAPPEYRGLVERLDELGLMPLTDLSLLVATSSKQSFKASLPRLLEYSNERISASQDLQLHQIVMSLRRAVTAFPTSSRHVVFVDGLDSIVTQKELQFQSLAALMHEASGLNLLFRRSGRPFKFVVLCRTDIFDRLPGANINKVRQDESVSLTWFDAPRDPERTRLLQMVNLRARQSVGREIDVFREFLPSEVSERDTRQVILDHTRHIPRDLVQALRKLQQHAGSAGRLTPRQVKSGLRAYSIEYFLPELRNELAGYLDPDDIDKSLTLLTSLQQPRITFADLERTAADLELGPLDLRALVRALFDASCIGTVTEIPGRRPHYTFKYRNPMATIMPGQAMRIHPGALKGLNIEPRPADSRRRTGRRRHASRHRHG